MHWAYSLNLLYKAFLEKLAAWIIMFIIICWSPLPYRCCHVLYPHIATLFSTELCCKWLCWWHLSQIFISVEVFTHQWVTSDKVFNLERSGSCLVSLSLRYFYGSLFAQGCAGLHSLQKLLTKLWRLFCSGRELHTYIPLGTNLCLQTSERLSRFCPGIEAAHSRAETEPRPFRAKAIAWISGLHWAFILPWRQESWNPVLVRSCFLWGHQRGQPLCQIQRGPETDLRH